MNRAIFMDRDGTVSDEVGYLNHVSRLRVFPWSPGAIRAINESPLLAILVTNQAGVARGYFKEEMIGRVHDRLAEELSREGARLDAVYYCPHHAEYPVAPYNVACDHRKPGPGMLRSAAEALGLDLTACWMVGDRESDVRAGHAAGCRAVRIGTGDTAAEARAESLAEAAEIILRDQTQSAA